MLVAASSYLGMEKDLLVQDSVLPTLVVAVGTVLSTVIHILGN